MEMTEQWLAEIEARAAAVYPQDAGWSGYEAEDALPVVRDDVPALVAEVRRLRAESEERLRTIQRVAEALDAAPPMDLARQVRWIVEEMGRRRTERDESRAENARLRAYMAEIGAEDVRCTCGSGAHPRHCKRHPWGFAAHVAELNSDVVGDWMNEAMDMERERDEARAERDRLCAVIDGSPDAPTDDELAAHTGAWLARLYNGAFATMTATAVRNARGVLVRGGPYAVRWWAIDSDERFCPRPVVTIVAATLGAGPRDADGREVTP